MGARVGRIERDRPLEQERGPVQRLVALAHVVQHALGEGLVGFDDLRLFGAAAGRAARGRHVQAGAQLADQAVLQVEDLGEPAVRFHRLLHLAGGDVEQPGGDTHRVAGALEAAGQHPTRPHLASHAQRHAVVGVGRLGAEAAERLVDAAPRNQAQARHAAQVRGQRLRDAGAQPVVFAAAGDVGEGQDGHEGDRIHGARRLAAAQPLEVLAHRAHVGMPAGGLLGQHPAEQRVEAREPRIAAGGQRRRVGMEHHVQDLHGVGAGEAGFPAASSYSSGAQREHVRARIDAAPEGLLGSHVGEGAARAAPRPAPRRGRGSR